MAEEDVLIRVNYQLQGVEDSISTSKRALFTLNAVRLSIRDIQQVLSGPTIANVLFTAIQLTRTLTQARRLTKALTAEQGAAGVAGLFGGAARGIGAARGGGAGRAFSEGQLTLPSALLIGPRPAPPSPGFFTALLGLAAANPLGTALVVGTFAVGFGAHAFFERERKNREVFRERNREIAKAQGLEP